MAKTVNAQNVYLLQAERELQALHIVEALALFHRGERDDCDPDLCAAGRWQCHMFLGDFERAWCESDRIGARGKPDLNRFWDGRPLDGKRVLLRCLHGFGDTIQFVRYARVVRRIARHLTIEAQPALKGLIRDSQIADQVITWNEEEPEWDQQIETMELPRIFRTTLEKIPSQVPYLCVRGAQERRQRTPSEPLKIGLVWNSSAFNHARSIPIAELAQIFRLPGLEFYALQYGPEHNEARQYPEVRDLNDRLITVEDTARIMSGLDLVITVDTMAAHLAGALATPVWTLLPYQCDWRWMLNREDSPWYPTMRLFRQPSPGDWSAVVRRLKAELRILRENVHRNGCNAYWAAAGTVK